ASSARPPATTSMWRGRPTPPLSPPTWGRRFLWGPPRPPPPPAECCPPPTPSARQFAAELKQPVPAFTADAKRLLETYSWPGNVRELKNVVERAVVLHPGVLAPEHLPESLAERAPPETRMVREQIADVERAAIVAAMEAT